MKKAGKAKGGGMGMKAAMKAKKAMKGGEMGDMMPVAMPPMSKKGGKKMMVKASAKKMK